MIRLVMPVFMAVPKPMLTEFGIHHRFKSCAKVTINGGVGYGLLKEYGSGPILWVFTKEWRVGSIGEQDFISILDASLKQ